ncbi:symmetrical bis(5'-nucleosyl)-tetraphosphatase [Bordetella avium]|uniref:Bis(5'-nucleosyl)-tetraphosphatase, symmetrical n=1 Tax=Bordetella avium (strain 197N) TaxID=360910 RepID=Q2KUT9_BORA1|nr:symmetrical bis(5'-nucleosyl)-tetraphosphatase [Bordetella avium]AZY50353.1 symmetrical bis(5'-nucleosyl)-tetraphosphatase [Bordetella avium]AZY53746.1 symmetrical bis(5'-nucleosyl)-tetraphosphatase [Bordetella avium]RIQ15479.1 symmetrical bis(5'-nucleosyl)-tetraphosphatase [Bordetella avium]RIQ19714.1 symmetrical bis(5'-nucleosyl)-tetraphosphatase [Bordetella avium]RIQ34294.1 symmetrical bis(5'-nucleosyl)-tetraphosphatase [Bordetella avium]
MATGSIWMIGDVQGCCTPLQQLLAHPDIAGEPGARFWFAGDLVNRGPESLATLRRIIALGDRAVAILGNHDLHLLAAAAGVRKPSKSDTLNDILNAPDADDLIDWLRHRPLAHYAHEHLMVHAGVLPKWNVAKTLALAGEVEAALRGPNWRKALQKMYGNEPVTWKDGHKGGKRLRVIINALTRMRLCTPAGHMEFATKVTPGAWPAGLVPWFDVPNRATRDVTIVFGHWSTLGLLIRPHLICLDTGCVWGGALTAMRLQDRKLVHIKCSQFQDPLSE